MSKHTLKPLQTDRGCLWGGLADTSSMKSGTIQLVHNVHNLRAQSDRMKHNSQLPPAYMLLVELFG